MRIIKGFKKVVYAGVGVTLAGAEKGKQVFSDMARRGESAFGKHPELEEKLKAVQKKISRKEMLVRSLKKMSAEELEEIKQKIREAEEAAKDAAGQVKDQAESIREKAEDTAEAVKEKTKDAAESVKEKAEDALEAVNEKTDEA